MMIDDNKQDMDDEFLDEEFDEEFEEADGEFVEEFDEEYEEDAEEFGEEGAEDYDEEFDEEWGDLEDEEFGEEDYDTDAPQKGKKKSGKGNLVIIIAGVLVGAVAIFYLMSGGGEAPQQAQQTASNAAAQKQAEPAKPKPAQSRRDVIYGRSGEFAQDGVEAIENAEGGILNDPDILNQVKDDINSVEFSDELLVKEDEELKTDTPDWMKDDSQDSQRETFDVADENDTGSDDSDESIISFNRSNDNEQTTERSFDDFRSDMPPVPGQGSTDNSVLTPVPNLGLGDSDSESVEDIMMSGSADQRPSVQTSQTQDFDDFSPFETDETDTIQSSGQSSGQPSDGFEMNMDQTSSSTAVSNAGLNQKLDLLFARLDRVERKLDGLENTNSGSVDSQELKAVKRSLRSLENKIARLPAQTDRAASQKTSASKAPARSPVKSSTRVTSSDIQKTNQASVAQSVEKQINQNWVLRAAQPGSAMVSDKKRQNVRDVKVGDRLAGIGQIVNIGIVDGKWVVEGTEGRITQ